MLSYNEMKLVYKIVMVAISNGNTVNPKAYDPTPEEWKMLHNVANRFYDEIQRMKKVLDE